MTVNITDNDATVGSFAHPAFFGKILGKNLYIACTGWLINWKVSNCCQHPANLIMQPIGKKSACGDFLC